jgi:hypothetical protein
MDKAKPRDGSLGDPNKIKIHLKDDYTFEKVSYKEEILKNKIEATEYETIINEANKIMATAWAKKRINDQIKFPMFIIILAVLSIVLIFVYMFLLYSSVDNSNGESLVIASLVCVSVASITVFSLSIYNFCRETGKFKTLREIIKDDLNSYLSTVNKKFEGVLFFSYNYDEKCLDLIIAKSNDSKYSMDQPNLSQHDKDYLENKDINPNLESESALCSDNNIKIPKSNLGSQTIQPYFFNALNNLNTEEEEINKHMRAKSLYSKFSKEVELTNKKK